jgi:methylmalonyl-CoA/ethylmalonyl-CoA epimerase
MSPMNLATAPVSQIAIRVHDVDRAAQFYQDVLGVPFLFKFPGLAFFQSGQVRLMLSRSETGEHDHPSSVLYFKVQGIEGMHTALKAKGVEFVDQPHMIHRAPTHELWMTFFKDTEGNTMGIMEEKPV